MKVSACVGCVEFPCRDVDHQRYTIPDVEMEPKNIHTIMVSEAPPEDPSDYFYAGDHPFYMQTTAQAFKDAGIAVSSIRDVLKLGVYVTTAVKCGKTGYALAPETIESCSGILQKEVGLFPSVGSILLMGDTAIKSMNCIAKRESGKRIIPAGPTYKLRKEQYLYKNLRVFPSYLQTGRSYLIEESKRKMISDDIKAALTVLEKS